MTLAYINDKKKFHTMKRQQIRKKVKKERKVSDPNTMMVRNGVVKNETTVRNIIMQFY